ncbi:MBL fold metallo-hydrolase [Enterobacter ludwigii]|nr:MBL fold metallo-hydrolase [Enterobacter ludwigii]
MFKNIIIALYVSLFSSFTIAAAPFSDIENPGFYRIKLGEFEVTALWDGISSMPAKEILINTKPGQINNALMKSNLSLPLPTSVNAYLVNTGEKLILIDAGTGNLHGPSLGHLVKNLELSGYKTEQIDEIYLTHLHPDHVGGLTLDNKIVFANAVVRVDEDEVKFWLSEDEKSKAQEKDKRFFDAAIASLAPYVASGKLKAFSGNQELTPGISVLDTRGHTPGHNVFVIESKGRKIVVLGDMIHVGIVQFQDPNVAIQYDINPDAAVMQRKALFDSLAEKKDLVAGAHLSFPGFGYISKNKDGYDWHPLDYGVLNN